MAGVDKIIAAYQGQEGKNSLITDVPWTDVAKYKAGIKPDERVPYGKVAALQSMVSLMGATRLLKGGSRAMPALQMALGHTFQPTNTPDAILSKAHQMKGQFQDAADAILNVTPPGTAQQTADRFNAPAPGATSGGSFQTTATGAGGHKIGSNDGGKTWVDVQTGQPVGQ